eukprot:TRINITY_DN3564_c0_g1_i1.p1 TRINITY_DN3564_c0_g1~~TRINITY_DN3564_c0_g1_i1.p1  ORF type:complete len:163 (-),score=32.73 TRINITY_DN3564_c0_g1_i1:33-521(-)
MLGQKNSSPLHLNLAETYLELDMDSKCLRSFVRSGEASKLAVVLFNWGRSGPSSNRDLMVVNGVLQFLCLGNLKAANELFTKSQELDAQLKSPLINFTRFLLLTLERDAYPLLQSLRQKYHAVLNRDPQFLTYLDRIAAVFYQKKSQQGGMGFLADLMKGLM